MNLNKLSVLGMALLMQILTVNAQASDISGVDAIQSGNSSIYNINPSKINSSGIGFRQYDNFELSKGDAANFIMSDISKFVNLVDSKVSINGLVNTVNPDFSKSNGGLVFISPEGFVVGSSGVLNVGSLSVYTPDTNTYGKLTSDLTDSITNNTDTSFSLNPSSVTYGSGVITIDGSLIASGDINLNSKEINIGKSAHIINGINTNNTFMNKTPDTSTIEYAKPEDIFTSLVNTGEFSFDNANITLQSNNGDIKIGGLVDAKNGDINITVKEGNLVNAGSTDILLASAGDLNVTVTGGKVGDLPPVSTTGTQVPDLTKSVNIQAGGDVNIKSDGAVNITGLNKDLVIDNITSGDVIYLNVDKTPDFLGDNPGIYSSQNHQDGTPNVSAGGNIIIHSSGDIGSKTNGGRFTLSSQADAQQFNTSSWHTDKVNYTPFSGEGIEIRSEQGDIYIKNNDAASNIKEISAQNGSIDAQFKGDTYIENISAPENIEVTTQGNSLYVKNLDNTSNTAETGKASLKALGLNENIENSSDSTVILKNGKIHDSADSSGASLEITGDNIYANGMHAAAGKDRVENSSVIDYKNGSHIQSGDISVTNSNGTSEITTEEGGNPAHIRFNSVTEDDVKSAEPDENLGRIYYTGDENSVDINNNNGVSLYSAQPASEDADFGDTDTDIWIQILMLIMTLMLIMIQTSAIMTTKMNLLLEIPIQM